MRRRDITTDGTELDISARVQRLPLLQELHWSGCGGTCTLDVATTGRLKRLQTRRLDRCVVTASGPVPASCQLGQLFAAGVSEPCLEPLSQLGHHLTALGLLLADDAPSLHLSALKSLSTLVNLKALSIKGMAGTRRGSTRKKVGLGSLCMLGTLQLCG